MVKERVYVFVGDMAAEMGCFNEAVKYAMGQQLPITFIVEDNELGCETPTKEAWGCKTRRDKYKKFGSVEIYHYQYVRHYPHCGTGDWLTFKKKFKSTGNYDAYKQ